MSFIMFRTMNKPQILLFERLFPDCRSVLGTFRPGYLETTVGPVDFGESPSSTRSQREEAKERGWR